MTRETTEKTTETGTATVKKEQPDTAQTGNWLLAIQNLFSVPRAIHREIC